MDLKVSEYLCGNEYILVRDFLLSYPNFSEYFITNKCYIKMNPRGLISQNGKPIVFYSCELIPAQTNYTNTEIELLSIMETLK